MLSTIYDGKVLDWSYKKMTIDDWYAFYIGDIYVGQVSKRDRDDSWTAISAESSVMFPVTGFQTRYYASKFLIEIQSYDRAGSRCTVSSSTLSGEVVAIHAKVNAHDSVDDVKTWAKQVLENRHDPMNEEWYEERGIN